MSILLAAAGAALFGIGTYLVLQRKLSRIIIGLGLISHGANVLFVLAGQRGRAPLVGRGDPADFADPFPQALALTAIVITFGVTAFLLALAYRSWLLTRDDEVEDDLEDRLVAGGGFRDTEVSDAEESSAPAALETTQ
jgi:multicomponent Na+:H+ antiporter subunit C